MCCARGGDYFSRDATVPPSCGRGGNPASARRSLMSPSSHSTVIASSCEITATGMRSCSDWRVVFRLSRLITLLSCVGFRAFGGWGGVSQSDSPGARAPIPLTPRGNRLLQSRRYPRESFPSHHRGTCPPGRSSNPPKTLSRNRSRWTVDTQAEGKLSMSRPGCHLPKLWRVDPCPNRVPLTGVQSRVGNSTVPICQFSPEIDPMRSGPHRVLRARFALLYLSRTAGPSLFLPSLDRSVQ